MNLLSRLSLLYFGPEPTPGELWKRRGLSPFRPTYARINRASGGWIEYESESDMHNATTRDFVQLFEYVARWHSKNRTPTNA